MDPGDGDYPIRPSMIDASGHLWEAFGHSETEASAGWIVRFCQDRGGDDWRPFSREEIDGYCRGRGGGGFAFNRLLAENLRSRPFVMFAPGRAITGETPALAPLPGEGPQGLVVEADGRYRVTHQFVARCFGSSPRSAS